MTIADILGSFLWHDLMTTDPGAAGDFYPKVLGWKSEAMEGSDYKVWTTPKGMSGGTSQLESDAQTPSHWLAYVGTPDIEATIDKAKELGGRLVKEVKEVSSVGKYAVIADPQGALIALYSPESADSTDTGSSFTWHELATSDLEAAWDFYSELFGWSKEGEHDMGPGMGIYLLFGQDGKQLGGMYKQPADRPSAPNWLSYMSVSSAADAAEATKDAGGQVANGPMEVPGGDLIAQLIDPQGAFFAVHQAGKKAAKAKKPKKSAAPKREIAEAEPVDATEAVSAAEDEESTSMPAAKPAKKKAASKSNGAAAASKTKAAPKKAAAKTATAKTKAAAKSKAPAAKKSAKKKAAPAKAAVKKSAPKKAAAKKAVVKKSKKTAAVKKSAAPAKKKASKKKATKKK
jgi:predicted enzyme related to lactoylglutathione lyase